MKQNGRTSSSRDQYEMPDYIDYREQQQFGRINHKRDSYSDAGDSWAPPSPTAWICQAAGKNIQNLCRPFMSGNYNVQLSKEDPLLKQSSDHGLRLDNSAASLASWRKRAAESILSGDGEDSDNDNDNPYRNSISNSDYLKGHPDIKVPSLESDNDDKWLTNEPRIVAPHVSKLSPASVVEVRLQSLSECVAILCSVDVLKMRSIFFHEVLIEQEESRVHNDRLPGEIWREPLLIPEISPFEAIAFIEFLHEGRFPLAKGEQWNFSWARLSVSWQVQELIIEYASQIESHFDKLIKCVEKKNWRISPNVLLGAKVAVFRKTATSMPTVLTGVVIEAAPSTGYSKLRVLYDNNDNSTRGSFDLHDTRSVRHTNNLSSTTLNQLGYAYSNYDNVNHTSNPFIVTENCDSPVVPKLSPHKASNSNITTFSTIPIGSDIGEDFWIQLPLSNVPNTPQIQAGTKNQAIQGQSKFSLPIPHTPLRGQGQDSIHTTDLMWYDPDELFITDIKKYVTTLDIRLFWEMARAIMELPKLSEHCHAIINNSMSLAALLKKMEYRFLFSEDSSNILPRDAAIDLVAAAYVVN